MKSVFENTMGNVYFFILAEMLQKKDLLVNYIGSYFKKKNFGFHFGPREKPNKKMHESESALFIDWTFPEVQN